MQARAQILVLVLFLALAIVPFAFADDEAPKPKPQRGVGGERPAPPPIFLVRRCYVFTVRVLIGSVAIFLLLRYES